jgi:hypothetical protein
MKIYGAPRKSPYTYFVGDHMILRVGLDIVDKIKICCPCRASNLDCPSRSPSVYHSQVRVPWDSRSYFTVSDLKLPFSSPPTTRRVTVEVFDPASTRNRLSYRDFQHIYIYMCVCVCVCVCSIIRIKLCLIKHNGSKLLR